MPVSKYKQLLGLLSQSALQTIRKELPKLDESFYWGPGKAPDRPDLSIRPFKLQVPNEVLDDLEYRLKTSRKFTPPLEGVKQDYGFNTELLQEIVDFWIYKYNWKEREDYLNQYSQYKTNIQGLDIHYVRVTPTAVPNGVQIFPLLLLHGWPSSFREFYGVIPLLSQPLKNKSFAFDVIVPSLPGFTFSDAASKQGLAWPQMGIVFKNLMTRLGIERYYIHGGDWGSQIATSMACLYPEHVLGLHINMCMSSMSTSLWKTILGSLWPKLIVEKQFEGKLYPLKKKFIRMLAESGYYHIQSTKPDTIGVALNQSPVGLAAYYLEKFSTLTNPRYLRRKDGGLLEKFTYIDLLDNIMLHWITNCATTAARIYAENYHKETLKLALHEFPVSKEVPVAFAKSPYEVVYQPDFILRDRYPNLVQSTTILNAGHFFALEEPSTLAEDIYSAVEKMRKY